MTSDDALVEQVESWVDRGTTEHPGRVVELFVRVARRRRVRVVGGRASRATIVERGLAARVASRGGSSIGFSATTRIDDDGVRGAVERASGRTTPSVIPITPTTGRFEDVRPHPTRAVDLADLDLHADRIRDVLRPPVEPIEMILEAGEIEEILVTSNGLTARRVRTRAWVMLDVGNSMGRRTRFLAGAPDGRLPDPAAVAPWAEALAACNAVDATRPYATLPWRLQSEAAGVFVRAVAHALHRGDGDETFPVGPGWVLADDPAGADALFGGRFDDTGQSTCRTELADGVSGRRGPNGPGHAWRASFRDPPEVRAADLVVGPGPDAATGPFLDWLDLKITAVDPGRWVLEGLVRDPDRGASIMRQVANPYDLVRHCVASQGVARSTSDGVRTGTLMFAP